MIRDRLKKKIKLQDSTELNNLGYKTKSEKKYNFIKISLPIMFLRDIYINKNVLSIEKADN